jgi:hypothetical protein
MPFGDRINCAYVHIYMYLPTYIFKIAQIVFDPERGGVKTSVTRWVYEKIAQNVAQSIICQNYYVINTLGKK